MSKFKNDQAINFPAQLSNIHDSEKKWNFGKHFMMNVRFIPKWRKEENLPLKFRIRY